MSRDSREAARHAAPTELRPLSNRRFYKHAAPTELWVRWLTPQACACDMRANAG